MLEAFQYLPHTFVQRRWTPEEDDNLELAVLRHFQVTFLSISFAAGTIALLALPLKPELALCMLQEAKHTRILAEAVESGALPSGQELTDQATRVGKLTLASPGASASLYFLPGVLNLASTWKSNHVHP